MKTRALCLFALAALFAFLFAFPAEARVRPSHRGSAFYYPLPYVYEPDLVKVFDNIQPGTTTLQEVLDTRGYPQELINNRFFYYQWDDFFQGRREHNDVYLEFRHSKRLGKARYDKNGLELTAVVTRAYVYSYVRMSYYSTYLDQIERLTVYPHETYYNRADDYYTLVFPYQGYAMYFDGNGRLDGEVYFEPERYEYRQTYSISVGNFNFSFTRTENLPPFLR